MKHFSVRESYIRANTVRLERQLLPLPCQRVGALLGMAALRSRHSPRDSNDLRAVKRRFFFFFLLGNSERIEHLSNVGPAIAKRHRLLGPWWRSFGKGGKMGTETGRFSLGSAARRKAVECLRLVGRWWGARRGVRGGIYFGRDALDFPSG